LATARFAGATPSTAGIFRVGMAGASVQIDPQLSYISTGWWLEYATAAKLYNWSDRGTKLVPEVASRVVVANRGRTYTFLLRKGFRFSDGSPVTAKSFAYAIDRVANKDLASPGAAFITDSSGLEIVGAQKVNAGRGTRVSGVQAKGPYKLVIRLVRPDPSLLSKLTMPFFQATSKSLPLSQEVVAGYPSAGPYYFASNEVNALTTLRRNPYWRGARPAHLDGVDVQWGLNEQTAFHQVEANQLDEGPIPAAEAQGVVDQYGVNKTRFWSKPTNCLGYLALNSQRPIFRRVTMRKAINWAVDRTAVAGEAGVALGSPWTHLLPPLFPGSVTKKRLQPYSVRPNLEKARKLAGDSVRYRRIRVAYRATTAGQAQAEVVRQELIQLGFKAEKITLIGFSGGAIYTAMGSHGSDLDMGVALGWCADYPGTANFLSFFVQPPFGVDSEKYRAKLATTNRLPEPARTQALGRLDLEITKNLAPAAVLRTYNNRFFFSNRVDPHSLIYSGAYQDWSIPAFALK
jgi:ABC-type transport system substrate-binding protein